MWQNTVCQCAMSEPLEFRKGEDSSPLLPFDGATYRVCDVPLPYSTIRARDRNPQSPFDVKHTVCNGPLHYSSVPDRILITY